jgi:hypothetical protein
MRRNFLLLLLAVALVGAGCSDDSSDDSATAPPGDDNAASDADPEDDPDAVESADSSDSVESAPVGETLEKEKQTITSAVRVDLTRDFATLPLHEGRVGDETVWFVITDVSDADMARELGINHSPKLANVATDCPTCLQTVRTDDPVLGRELVTFEGAPDFSERRTLVPGPTNFPAKSFSPGAIAEPGYSPFVVVQTDDPVVPSIIFNAPIVATGDGPFDVTTHENTHDRTLAIDTDEMTTDHLFVRGFANGKSILYLSFESSDSFTATIERSTFVPGLADLAFANGGGDADSARSSIFTFVNAMMGLEESPSERGASQGEGRSQGLMHALSLDIVGLDAAVANPEVLEGLRTGGDVSNIFDVFPTNELAEDRAEYSPAWDLQVGVYSDDAVAQQLHTLKTDANVVRREAGQGIVTAPGGRPLGSANILSNCPALGFLDDVPVGPRVPSLTTG